MSLFRKFCSYYKPYRAMFYLDMLCAVVVSAVDLIFPQLLRFLTNDLFQQGAERILTIIGWIGLGMLGGYLIKYVCQKYITTQGHVMGARMESDMRQQLFDHYQRLSFSYYDRNNTGEMVSKLISDLFDISELAHHGPENLFISTLKIVGSFILLCCINWQMTLILLAVTAVMIGFSLYQNRKMHRIFTDNRRKIAKVNARVQDSLLGIKVVKSFANESLESEKFRDSNDQFLRSKEDNYEIMGRYHAGNGFFQGLLYITVLVTGGVFVAKNLLSATDLAVFALYIGIFINPIEVLINFTEQFQKGVSGFRRFVEIIDTDPEIKDAPNARPLEAVAGRITYDDVSFSYNRGEEVLNHVDLDIAPGRTVALVGPSGGGKSTICSLLPRFYDVAEGAVRIDGQDIRNVTVASLRAAIGMVQQDVYLFAGTVRENIVYGRPEATEEEIVEAARRANIHDFVTTLPDGYDTYVGERGARLSGGQKQRISIARVFLKNPRILILDEATSALDNESERHIQEALDALSEGRTTLVIAHRLSTIRNADEILVVEEGRITERGTHEELLKREGGLYRKYYTMQEKA